MKNKLGRELSLSITLKMSIQLNFNLPPTFKLVRMTGRVDSDPRATEYIMGSQKYHLKRYCRWMKSRYGSSIYMEYVYPKYSTFSPNQSQSGFWKLTSKYYHMIIEAGNWIKQKEDEFFGMLESGSIPNVSMTVEKPIKSLSENKPHHIKFDDSGDICFDSKSEYPNGMTEQQQLQDWVERIHC